MKKRIIQKLGLYMTAACLTAAPLAGCGRTEDTEQGAEVLAGDVSGTVENAAAENIIAVGEMFSDRDASGEYKESECVKITLNGKAAQCDSRSVAISGGTVTIGAEGTYILSGTLDEGMIIVEADDKAKVQLVLDGVTVLNSSNAAIYVKSADKVFVTLAEGTVNTLGNGGSYQTIDDNNIDGVIFSKSDLTVNGSGSLTITAESGHGVVSKDDLKVTGGSVIVEAESHGLCGKDSVRIAGGTVNITSGRDGIHADNDEDAQKGYVYIADGTLAIKSGGDGISASGLLQIDGGSFDITSGGGSSNKTVARDESGDAVSTKGVKAAGDIVINNGSFKIDSQDDSLHTNGSMTVNGGDYQIATGDDGLHGDGTTTVAGGRILITTSYEGIEGNEVVVSGGFIDLYASDDGLNAAGGKDQSGFGGIFGGFGGGFGGNSSSSILISGGTVCVNADGDGIDSNGALKVTGGTVYVDGPADSANGAMDYDGVGEITGGRVIALGASGMAQSFTTAANQGVIFLNTGNQKAGTEVSLKDADGLELFSYTSKKAFGSVVVSCPEVVQGGTYTLTVGGSDTEITMDSLIYGNDSGGFGGGHGGMGGFGPDRGGRGDWNAEGQDGGGRRGMGGMPDGAQPGTEGLPGMSGDTQPGTGSGSGQPSGDKPDRGGARDGKTL